MSRKAPTHKMRHTECCSRNRQRCEPCAIIPAWTCVCARHHGAAMPAAATACTGLQGTYRKVSACALPRFHMENIP